MATHKRGPPRSTTYSDVTGHMEPNPDIELEPHFRKKKKRTRINRKPENSLPLDRELPST